MSHQSNRRGPKSAGIAPSRQVPEISAEMVDAYVRRGKRLQAEAMRAAAGALWRRLRGAERPDRRDAPLSQSLLNALAAMRASMEVLRDAPDISAEDRARFLRAALHEEARVESLVRKVLSGGRETA